MAQNLTQFDAVLKEFYGPGIVEELNEQVPFLKLIEKDAGLIKFDGRRWLVPIHTGRNGGIGARAESAVLPTPGAQTYDDYTIKPTYQYGGIKVTGQVIQQSRTDKGAFGRAVQLEMEGLRNQFRSDLNFQFQRDGKGVRTTISTGANSTSQSVAATPYDLLYEGMVVDIYSSDLGTKRGTATINSVTLDPKTWNVTAITLSGTVNTTTNDVVIRSGNLNMEISGIDAIVGAGSYGGIDPATRAVWQSPVLDNGGTLRPINYSLFQQAIDVSEKAGGGNPEYFFTTYDARRNFFLYMTSEKRVVNTKKYDGGFESVEYNGKEIFVDRMAKANTMYGIDPEYLYRLETRELHWIDDDGTILHRSFDNTDTYFANMRYYVQLAATKRNAMVKIADIQE
jgi:hypothetical protein